MPDTPTVSIQVLRALIEGVVQAGVPREPLLRAADVDATRLEDAGARLSRDAIDRVCELAIALSDDPALALHWSQRISLGDMGPLNHMLAHAGTLRHGLELARRFGPLLADQPSYQLKEDAREATIEMVGLADRTPLAQRFLAEMVMGCFTRLIQLFSRGRITRASFAYPMPRYLAAYRSVFGAALHFDAPCTAIVFDRTLLDRPSEHRDEEVVVALRGVMERRMVQVTSHPSYALRVRKRLIERPARRMNMTAVARSLGLSVRSLRRHLAAEGASFQEVEYEARAHVAKQLLQADRTIEDTAYEMGFSDAATFHRAFKRWTGSTPSAFKASRSAQARSQGS